MRIQIAHPTAKSPTVDQKKIHILAALFVATLEMETMLIVMAETVTMSAGTMCSAGNASGVLTDPSTKKHQPNMNTIPASVPVITSRIVAYILTQ